MDFDLKTDEGLRSAFEAKAREIEPESLDRVNRFLEDVAATPAEERATPEFQKRIWRNNPAVEMPDGVGKRIEKDDFAKWFAERLPRELPAEPAERNEDLIRLVWDIANRKPALIQKSNGPWRPLMQTRRALVALYPEHTAGTCFSPRIKNLAKAMGGAPDSEHPDDGRRSTFEHLWIRSRLDEVLDTPVDMRDHALRVLVSGELATMVNKKRHVWLFRAGRKGEDEEAWLEKGLAFIGWGDTGDLSGATNRQDIQESVEAAYPDQPGKKIGQWTGNLERFTLRTKPGDLVVMPRKYRDVVAIGVIAGAYAFQEVDSEQRHTLPVDWKKRDAPREQVGQKLKRRQTVHLLGGNDLAERIEALPEPKPGPPSPSPVADIVDKVTVAAAERKLDFDRKLIENLHYGLWSHERRHFAILAGLSGSGKTQLAWEYARAVTGAESEFDIRFVAVSAAPGWHDPTALLGYVNPLSGNYVGTDFQRFLVNASENPTEIHACVLDEMNLSHPEQYLAPLLSAMERKDGRIELHDGDEENLGVPGRIPYPANLVLIGTVNMDETTMGLSDKVLDRAFTLEFWDIDVDAWPGWADCRLAEADRVKRVLNELMKALRPARLHFGWRVIAECVAFLTRHEEGAGDASEALDTVLYAKLLPKLRGDDSERYRNALDACRAVFRNENLQQSEAKVGELIEDLNTTGHFRFWR